MSNGFTLLTGTATKSKKARIRALYGVIGTPASREDTQLFLFRLGITYNDLPKFLQ